MQVISKKQKVVMGKRNLKYILLKIFLFNLGAIFTLEAGILFNNNNKPNIIIIVADDLGWGDVGYNGSKIKTPNLDRLSVEGIMLDRFYVAPVCSPTRAGFLTGKYPNRFGLRETVIPPWRDFGLDPENEMLPEFLAKHGYKNRAIIGKWHLGHSRPEYYPLNKGFTRFYGHLNGEIDYFTHEREGELDWHNDFESSYDEGYATDLIAEESVRFIKEYAKHSPFFLYVAFNAPHTPLQAKEEDLKIYGYDETKPTYSKKNREDAPGQGNTRKQTYAAMVTCMDRGIGKILQTLKDLQLENETLVLFFSDNGADEGSGGGSSNPLRGHKFHEFDGGVRVPAIISWPGRFESPRVISQLTGFVDVFPTICDIVNPKNKDNFEFDGISVLPILERKQVNISRSFYLGCGALIENEWKIIRAGRNPRMYLDKDVLFNLIEDPYETNDLAEKYPDRMKRLLEEVMKMDTIEPDREVLPYHIGREGFVPPVEWNIFEIKN
jgi:arylsulfatase B